MTITSSLDVDALSRAVERHGVAQLPLFGSAVRGGLATDSDVEFPVDFLPGVRIPSTTSATFATSSPGVLVARSKLVVERAIRKPYFRDSVLAQAETVYAVDVWSTDLACL
ncbi:hypothetical protein [Kocuria salsicia]|uniref:hypothetical protein n=1 Tax=Kocuria salsicia TaxID=664639 RepID=UPI0012EDD550|nr:hypothetical protein [Kocuria salsicia]